jgi:predicted transcriptional regulator
MDPNKSEEARKAYELSLAGYSQRQIAEKMGHSQSWVRDRLKLHIENRVHPKADEFRAKQIDRAQIYIRSLWSAILAGDPKAIAQAVRTEERISKLLGLDSATAFTVAVENVDDRTEFNKMLDRLMGQEGRTEREGNRPHPQRKPMTVLGSAIANVDKTHNPANEFADAIPAHQIQEFEPEPVEEFEPAPRPRRRGRPVPNPADQFLRDSDDD